MAKLKLKSIEALIAAAESVLAGEEGVGDCADVAFDDLTAGSEWLKAERDRIQDALDRAKRKKRP